MNLEAILRSFTDEEEEALRTASEALLAGRPLTPAEQAANLKWAELGGDEAVARKHAGLDAQPPQSISDVLEHFNDAEQDLLNQAIDALRAHAELTIDQETQYARWLEIGGSITHIIGDDERERRILERHRLLALPPVKRPPVA